LNATNYAESAIGSTLFLGAAMPSITQWSIGLFTGAPSEDGTGGTEVAASGTGYARARIDPGANWGKRVDQNASSQTVFYNAVNVQFNAATASWGTVTHFCLFDQSGNPWVIAPLTASKTIGAGSIPIFLAGELEVALG